MPRPNRPHSFGELHRRLGVKSKPRKPVEFPVVSELWRKYRLDLARAPNSQVFQKSRQSFYGKLYKSRVPKNLHYLFDLVNSLHLGGGLKPIKGIAKESILQAEYAGVLEQAKQALQKQGIPKSAVTSTLKKQLADLFLALDDLTYFETAARDFKARQVESKKWSAQKTIAFNKFIAEIQDQRQTRQRLIRVLLKTLAQSESQLTPRERFRAVLRKFKRGKSNG